MNNDFHIRQETLKIPSEAYKPIKRCAFCQSVFINDRSCESCGRSMHYHPIGEPFDAKSFYGIKERYIESLNAFIQFFPVFENKKSPFAKSYIRKLEKRFLDLISAFNSENMITEEQKKLFSVECIGIIDELLCYGTLPSLLQALLIDNDGSETGENLLQYINEASQRENADIPWQDQLMSYRLWGVLRFDFFLKVFIFTATVLTMAVKFKDIISSQFGK